MMRMNPVLMLVHNNLELTKRAVASVMAQDIEIRLLVVANEPAEGIEDWLNSLSGDLDWIPFIPQIGVSAGWNWGLRYHFRHDWGRYALVLNNDVILPPYFYRTLLDFNWPFVTGMSVSSMDGLK